MKLQPYDPLNVPASPDGIKIAKREIVEGNIRLDDGKVIQADRDSIESMTSVLDVMQEGDVIYWRLADNTSISLDDDAMFNLLEDIKILKGRRLVAVDAQYLSIKTSSPTCRDLEEWKSLHRV